MFSTGRLKVEDCVGLVDQLGLRDVLHVVWADSDLRQHRGLGLAAAAVRLLRHGRKLNRILIRTLVLTHERYGCGSVGWGRRALVRSSAAADQDCEKYESDQIMNHARPPVLSLFRPVLDFEIYI